MTYLELGDRVLEIEDNVFIKYEHAKGDSSKGTLVRGLIFEWQGNYLPMGIKLQSHKWAMWPIRPHLNTVTILTRAAYKNMDDAMEILEGLVRSTSLAQYHIDKIGYRTDTSHPSSARFDQLWHALY